MISPGVVFVAGLMNSIKNLFTRKPSKLERIRAIVSVAHRTCLNCMGDEQDMDYCVPCEGTGSVADKDLHLLILKVLDE